MNDLTETIPDTVPRIAWCRGCHALVLHAWIEGQGITLGVSIVAAETASLAHSSGHTVFRVHAARRPTLTPVRAEADVVADHRYVLGHTCAPVSAQAV